MAKTWTLKDPKEMPASSEADVQKYGRAYWSYTYDSDMPLMFNLMDGAVGDGTVVSAEEWVNKESAKGTEYLRLRKVKIMGGSDAKPAQTSSMSVTNDTSKLLELVYADTQEILRILNQTVPPQSLKEQWDKTTARPADIESVPDNVDEDIGDEPMDLSQIPF